jgi:hypothetical protein
MVLYLCVLIVFSLHRESLKFILATNPSLSWFCHILKIIKHVEREQTEKMYILEM